MVLTGSVNIAAGAGAGAGASASAGAGAGAGAGTNGAGGRANELKMATTELTTNYHGKRRAELISIGATAASIRRMAIIQAPPATKAEAAAAATTNEQRITTPGATNCEKATRLQVLVLALGREKVLECNPAHGAQERWRSTLSTHRLMW